MAHRSTDNFGMDKDLADKEAAKYDPALEAMAKGYIEELSGTSCDGDFMEWLHDGQVLCKMMNKVKPGAVKKINESTMPFKQMENISNFLQGCRSQLGMTEHDLFTTPDLHDAKSRNNVINGVINFSRAATKNGFSGPTIAPKESKGKAPGSKEWKVGEASSAVSKLSLGSSTTMERSAVDVSKNIGFGASISGTGSADSVSKLSLGSAGIMERGGIDKTKDINFGANAGNS